MIDCNCRRGWMLIQMTYFIVLLGVFSVMASELFMTTLTVRREAEMRERQVAAWSIVLGKLHRDAWAAKGFEMIDDATLQIEGASATILWHVDDDGVLRRDGLAWKALGRGVTFSREGAAIAMHVDRLKVRGGGEYLFASQVLLAEAMP